MSGQKPNRSPVLRLFRTYNATREEVFAAWTEPQQLENWLCAGDTIVSRIEVDLRVGGSFRIDMHHERGTIVHTGVYREITPPEKIVFTWSSENTAHQVTLVTVELIENGMQTELALTHELLPDEKTYQAHHFGWTSILEKLGWQLRS